VLIASSTFAADDTSLPNARPVPEVQAVPQPHDQVSLEWRGRELTRYHFGSDLRRPFLCPLVGPEGHWLTRMGHPHDPAGHSHHNSVWISHANVNGVDFWSDQGGRIVHQRVEAFGDASDRAWLLVVNAWNDPAGKTQLVERRRIEVRPIDNQQWMLLVDLQLEAPPEQPATLGPTPFGLLGVRMAKTIGVSDGGGRILNSEGQRNEAEVFRQPARWVDYSGPLSNALRGGITLLDHPANPGHPTPFHVRDDGWMVPSLTLRGPITIEPGQPLRLRYGLWAHAGVPSRSQCDECWQAMAQEELPKVEK
jgi:hypothetical protein